MLTNTPIIPVPDTEEIRTVLLTAYTARKVTRRNSVTGSEPYTHHLHRVRHAVAHSQMLTHSGTLFNLDVMNALALLHDYEEDMTDRYHLDIGPTISPIRGLTPFRDYPQLTQLIHEISKHPTAETYRQYLSRLVSPEVLIVKFYDMWDNLYPLVNFHEDGLNTQDRYRKFKYLKGLPIIEESLRRRGFNPPPAAVMRSMERPPEYVYMPD